MERRLSVRLMSRAADLTMYHVLLRPMEWLVRRFSSVGQRPFFDPSQFAWISRVEAGWKQIRDELCVVLKERKRIPTFAELSQEQLKITQGDKWKSYWLYACGRKIAENCRRCPETTRLLGTIPGMKTAFFSILAPRAHLSEHRGPYAGVLRYHLGLIVPRQKEACRIRVGSELAHWEEGRSIVFDDTYPHEVWNDTDEERVVLFVDVARPLSFFLSALNEAAIGVFSRTGMI
ncbi:MAG: aspartyl/asparaginyl beta-hydroxylase domain-containing protein, partial [Burkholderiales bacterium]